MQRQRGEAGLAVSQLGLDRARLAVQFPPRGVDHGPLGLRNLLRAILVKQINGKVFHHVAEEVFLGPSTEHRRRILERELAVSRADQADLMPTLGQLANFSYPEPALRVADPRAPLCQLQRNLFAARQRRFDLREPGSGQSFLGYLW